MGADPYWLFQDTSGVYFMDIDPGYLELWVQDLLDKAHLKDYTASRMCHKFLCGKQAGVYRSLPGQMHDAGSHAVRRSQCKDVGPQHLPIVWPAVDCGEVNVGGVVVCDEVLPLFSRPCAICTMPCPVQVNQSAYIMGMDQVVSSGAR